MPRELIVQQKVMEENGQSILNTDVAEGQSNLHLAQQGASAERKELSGS